MQDALGRIDVFGHHDGVAGGGLRAKRVDERLRKTCGVGQQL
jgi:hypothetical protein